MRAALTTSCWVQEVTEPVARAAFVWILGEYGQGIQVQLCSRCACSPALCRSQSTVPPPAAHPNSDGRSCMATAKGSSRSVFARQRVSCRMPRTYWSPWRAVSLARTSMSDSRCCPRLPSCSSSGRPSASCCWGASCRPRPRTPTRTSTTAPSSTTGAQLPLAGTALAMLQQLKRREQEGGEERVTAVSANARLIR